MAEMAADGQRQLVNIRNSLIRFKKRVKKKKREDGRDVFRVEWKGKKTTFSPCRTGQELSIRAARGERGRTKEKIHFDICQFQFWSRESSIRPERAMQVIHIHQRETISKNSTVRLNFHLFRRCSFSVFLFYFKKERRMAIQVSIWPTKQQKCGLDCDRWCSCEVHRSLARSADDFLVNQWLR